MSSTQDILEWTKFIFPLPIKIKEKESSKNIAIAGLILLGFFFAILIFSITVGIVTGDISPYYIILVFLMVALMCIMYIYVSKTRAALICLMDSKGITVKKGIFYSWEDLAYIKFYMFQDKYSDHKFFQSIAFNFKSGKAIADFRLPDFGAILEYFKEIPVKKYEKIYGS